MSTETKPIHVMDANAIQAQLAAMFPADAIRWKPQAVNGNKAMAVAYLSARDVQNRLDAVLGVGGWGSNFEVIAGGSVMCRLSLKIDDEWVTRTDVGSPSDQKDPGDRMKAAVSDALKRAAIQFGIGRYLYDLPKQWVGYNPAKKCLTETPELPAWAIPLAPQKALPPQQTAKVTQATVTDLIVLLKQLARIRGVDEVAQFANFIKSFAPNLKNIQEIPPDQMTIACTKVQKVIEKETEERGEY